MSSRAVRRRPTLANVAADSHRAEVTQQRLRKNAKHQKKRQAAAMKAHAARKEREAAGVAVKSSPKLEPRSLGGDGDGGGEEEAKDPAPRAPAPPAPKDEAGGGAKGGGGKQQGAKESAAGVAFSKDTREGDGPRPGRAPLAGRRKRSKKSRARAADVSSLLQQQLSVRHDKDSLNSVQQMALDAAQRIKDLEANLRDSDIAKEAHGQTNSQYNAALVEQRVKEELEKKARFEELQRRNEAREARYRRRVVEGRLGVLQTAFANRRSVRDGGPRLVARVSVPFGTPLFLHAWRGGYVAVGSYGYLGVWERALVPSPAAAAAKAARRAREAALRAAKAHGAHGPKASVSERLRSLRKSGSSARLLTEARRSGSIQGDTAQKLRLQRRRMSAMAAPLGAGGASTFEDRQRARRESAAKQRQPVKKTFLQTHFLFRYRTHWPLRHSCGPADPHFLDGCVALPAILL